jgi:hypothetical protein
MGWDRFEKLILALMRRVAGARDIKFRRYGTPGQSQHGIDLAGRDPEGRYIVVQCKEYGRFTAADLRAAVETFAVGKRPFDAQTFVVVTSASTQSTQLADELALLQDEYPDLVIDLWGSENVNDHLRNFADIVARFWTRETATAFCSGAPQPGVAVPPLDRQEQAERILLGPLNTSDVTPILRRAEARRAEDPEAAAALFGEVAERLSAAGFHGHALVLRRRQLDVLAEGTLPDKAIELAGELAVAALMRGERDSARSLSRLMSKLAEDTGGSDDQAPSRRRHVQLLDAAVADMQRPVGSPDNLLAALSAVRQVPDVIEPQYRHTLVLYLAEDLYATEPSRLTEIKELIDSAIEAVQHDDPESDVLLRLRLVRAEYDDDERRDLLKAARRHLVPKRAAALINAREGRRCALEGRVEDALEAWRDAVNDALHSGLDDDAADWLYAIRALNVKYGPWSTDLDNEHRLAQALRATSSGRILERSRDPSDAAMSALVGKKPIEAVLSARRWLIDACVTGSWAGEHDAADFLADLYADNREPALAASFYQRAGESKKLMALVNGVGDLLLPTTAWANEPWWVVNAQAAQVSGQEDLLDAETASQLLAQLIDLTQRGRAGELIDSPTQALTIRAAKSACRLAARGTTEQAKEVLDLLAADVVRERNRYFHTDNEHAECCVRIALTHPSLTYAALTRLIDLASYDTQPAQKALVQDEVIALLSARDAGAPGMSSSDLLSPDERAQIHARIVDLVERDLYLADIALEAIDPQHPLVQERAVAAHDRILARLEPDPHQFTFGSSMIHDSYLASLLTPAEAKECLDKLLEVAADPREAASNRQDALTGARNLVGEQNPDVRKETFEHAQPFVEGDRDGSALDDFTGEPHPLSSAKINMGSASLRGDGLKLAHAAADSIEQYKWVRERAIGLLRSDDRRDVAAAAVVIGRLPSEVTADIDAGLLASNEHSIVRQVAAVLAARNPGRHRTALLRLCSEPDQRIRVLVAESIARAGSPTPEPLREALEILKRDPRHSVRTALGEIDAPGAPTSS